jgi:hypothetical protein
MKCFELLRKDKTIGGLLKQYQEKEQELTVLDKYLKEQYNGIRKKNRDDSNFYPL